MSHVFSRAENLTLTQVCKECEGRWVRLPKPYIQICKFKENHPKIITLEIDLHVEILGHSSTTVNLLLEEPCMLPHH